MEQRELAALVALVGSNTPAEDRLKGEVGPLLSSDADLAIAKFSWGLAGCERGEPEAVASCAQMLKVLERLEAGNPHADLSILRGMLVAALEKAGAHEKQRLEHGPDHHHHHDHVPELEAELARQAARELLQAEANRPRQQRGPGGGGALGPGLGVGPKPEEGADHRNATVHKPLKRTMAIVAIVAIAATAATAIPRVWDELRSRWTSYGGKVFFDRQTGEYVRKCHEGYPFACYKAGEAAEQADMHSAAAKYYGKSAELSKSMCQAGDRPWSLEADNPHACWLLAQLYEKGVESATRSISSKRIYLIYESLCDSGATEATAFACLRAGAAHDTSRIGLAYRALELYDKACKARPSQGCARLGFMYFSGRRTGRDEDRALATFRAGCEGSDRQSCVLEEGLQYLRQIGRIRNLNAAPTARGSPVARSDLKAFNSAVVLMSAVPTDTSDAVLRRYLKAVNRESAVAQAPAQDEGRAFSDYAWKSDPIEELLKNMGLDYALPAEVSLVQDWLVILGYLQPTHPLNAGLSMAQEAVKEKGRNRYVDPIFRGHVGADMRAALARFQEANGISDEVDAYTKNAVFGSKTTAAFVAACATVVGQRKP